MNKKDREEIVRLLNAVEERIMSGKKHFGDPALRKFYLKKLKED